MRDTDFVARIGGDEFGVLLPNCTDAGAEVVVDRMQRAMTEGQRFSVGVALWDGAEPLPSLIARADQALYEDKARGRAGAPSTR